MGVPTILDIGMLFLTPHIKLLALILRIARQAIQIETDAFLRGDYLLYRSSGAKIARMLFRPER
jgi:hypothetical protein